MKFLVYYRVSLSGLIRFESVYLTDAEKFARHVYEESRAICEIDEVTRDAN